MIRTLITCASSEIGTQLAKSLTDHHLLLTSRSADKFELSNAESIKLDFFNEKSIDDAVHNVSGYQKINNIVFIIPRIPMSSEVFPSSEQWRETFENYFIKPLGFMQKIFDQELMSDNGKIVFLSGLSSKSALSHYALNNCLRSAWIGQAKTMALALGNRKISVNTLSLGGVMTKSYQEKLEAKAITKGHSFEEQYAQEISNIPLHDYASVEDVVAAIQSLIGPMSNHITGQNILLDGGFFRGY